MDTLRLGLALDLMLAGKAAVHHALDQALRRLAQENRARLRQGLQPGRQIDCVAERRDARVLASRDATYHCKPGVDADPQLRAHAVASLDRRRLKGEPLLDQQRRAAGAQRRVLQRLRHAEERHHAVTGEALDRATLLLDRIAQQLGDALHQRVGRFLSGALGKGGEPDEIGEQHRHLAALALDNGTLASARHSGSSP
jgi:hypothetical protein